METYVYMSFHTNMIGVGTERGLGYGYDSTMIICDV